VTQEAPNPPARPPVHPLVNPPRPRHFGWVNWRGLWTLYRRGAFRYLRYGVESIDSTP
jgi:hypothetical protein